MALNDLKQTNAEINRYGVISAPDKMTGSAAENKAVFDRLFRQVGAEKFNQLIDELQASGAAAQIGIATVAGLTGATTVQDAVEKIVDLLREMTQGAVADGSITEEKMADASVSNRALQDASVNTGNYVDKSITEEKFADASIPERAFQSETVGGETLKQKSVTTKHYADRSIGNDQLDDLCVGERNMMSGSVGGPAVKDASVTRAKLAKDALYSPQKTIGSTHKITEEDLGRKLKTGWNTNTVVTITQTNSKIIPEGAEIAIIPNCTDGGYVSVVSDGVRFAIQGDGDIRASGTSIVLADAFGMIALNKFSSNDESGDCWLITGNVEVV